MLINPKLTFFQDFIVLMKNIWNDMMNEKGAENPTEKNPVQLLLEFFSLYKTFKNDQNV